ncbi:MAG TPA: DUF433 domain-containing protein [Kamptonema sp.]|nr:DUF433 domain-containing protein [Kamptonema sp.]
MSGIWLVRSGDRAWYYKDNRLKITTMTSVSSGQSTIVRTEPGLAIAGTRITLYQLMDYICAGYPPTLIRNQFYITDEQFNAAMSYKDYIFFLISAVAN